MTYEKVVESCRYLLNNFPEAQASQSYLDSRLSPESQEKWKFGYFPNIRNLSVLTDLIDEKTLLEMDLLSSSKIEDTLASRRIIRDFFEDHPLVMPFYDPYGKVVALVGRSLLDDAARKLGNVVKYKNTSFKKGNYLFGLYENKQAILDMGCVYIVEGQFDVIKATEKGFKNIVALGSSGMSAYQFSVISRYSNNIYLLLDNDEAGQKGRKQIISKFGQLANICNFYLPDEYKDIDECITKGKFSSFVEIPFVVRD
jgi:DNA primase